ncbi:MAG: thiamine pyrophosphate-dependent enzyme [Rhodospirillaceae bacterium]
MTAINTTKGSSAFLALLKANGVTHMFGNPGTTELPIMDAMKDHRDLTYVLGLQESLVVAMADGYARASGQLTACNVHVAPGLGNAIGSIYNARFTGTPLIVTAGQQEQGHGLTEPLLYDPLVPMAEPVVKWAVEVNRLDDLPRIVHRAAKIATTAPTGPVFLSLPGDILNNEAGVELGRPTRVDTRTRPSDAALAALADRLLAAERPVMVVGDEIVKSDALAEAAAFAEALGAAVYQQSVPYGAHFPSANRCYIGGLSRDQKNVRDVLSAYDLMISVGADPLRMSVYSPIEPLPKDLPLIQIGLLDWEMGKNYPAEMALRGDVRETLAALTPILRAKGGDALAKAAEARIAAIEPKNWTATRAKTVDAIAANAAAVPIDPDWMTLQMVDALPANAVLVHEGLTTTQQMFKLLPYTDRYSYHGFASGGIGWAVPGAIGVQLADLSRPVCAVIGDGSSMYSIQALWTAANMKLPMTYIICNNKSYRIIKQRLKLFHGNDHFVGMDFVDPPIDFVGLAKSMGVEAERIEDPAKVKSAIQAAMVNPGPNLLDIVVDGTV